MSLSHEGFEALASAIDDSISRHTERYVGVLRRLVQFPSEVGTAMNAVQEYLAQEMVAAGLEPEMWAPSVRELSESDWFQPLQEHYEGRDRLDDRPVLVGRWGRGEGPSLLISGHVDVVPPGPLDQWTVEPYAGEIHNDRLYGRGAIDCKAGLAAAVSAVDCLRDVGFEPNGSVVVESTVDQEIGGAGAIAARIRGIRADAAITTEPTGTEVALASAGVFWVRVTVQGVAAHAAETWKGRNALNMATSIHEAVRAWGEGREQSIRHPLYSEYPVHATFNPGTFRSGGYPSTVPDQAVLEYRVGLVPGETVSVVLDQLLEVIRTAESRSDWLTDHPSNVELFGYYGEPTEIADTHPLTRSVASAFEKVKGRLPRFTGFTAACDMGKLQHLGGMPVLNIGCAGGGWHQPDEFADLAEYRRLIAILALSIAGWCSA